MKVAVVTPTIASKTLQTCIDSVKNQTYSDIIHYVFIDGTQYKTVANLALEDAPKVSRIILEDNVISMKTIGLSLITLRCWYLNFKKVIRGHTR
jgi:glycosyltransferase involved in cell wall biosynthesis